MKKLMVMSMVVMAVAAQPVLADGDRGRHYEHVAAQPKTAAEARAVLKDVMAEMAKYVQEKSYEEVHELSYSLENAVESLKNEKNDDKLAQKQLELIELYTDVVHHGSEDGKFDKVHRYFPTLEAEVAAFLAE